MSEIRAGKIPSLRKKTNKKLRTNTWKIVVRVISRYTRNCTIYTGIESLLQVTDTPVYKERSGPHNVSLKLL